MDFYVENLKKQVIDQTNNHDEIIIISGYFSADILYAIAKTNKKVTFYYGMYIKNGITQLKLNALKKLESDYSNFSAYFVIGYHVHSKCYIFKENGIIKYALVGSANVSNDGLSSGKNSELLVSVDLNPKTICDLNDFTKEVHIASKPINDPSIIINPPIMRSISVVLNKNNSRVFSGNQLVDNIPLYVYRNKKKVVLESSGLNWGMQKGHTSNSKYAEAYIPIKAFDIDTYPLIIPPLGIVGSGSGGKITRRQNPVTVTWDDNTVMKMLFQGDGPERPTKSRRITGQPYREYPKQLTTDSGGSELGEYLRKRLKVGPRALITYKDLKNYGRDFITLTLVGPNEYEADFSNS